jgi:hypothetical protein
VDPLTPAGLVLEALPFLPAGRGALILILGGLLVLPIALLFSRGGPRPRPEMAFVPMARPHPPARPAQQAPPTYPAQPTHLAQPAQPVQPAPQPAVPQGRGWAGTGLERALRQAVGWTELVAAEPGRYLVRLGHCGSCARGAPACVEERGALERAVQPYLRHAQVAEQACAQAGGRACTFEIRGW